MGAQALKNNTRSYVIHAIWMMQGPSPYRACSWAPAQPHWKLVRNAESQAIVQPSWSRAYILTVSQGYLNEHNSWNKLLRNSLWSAYFWLITESRLATDFAGTLLLEQVFPIKRMSFSSFWSFWLISWKAWVTQKQGVASFGSKGSCLWLLNVTSPSSKFRPSRDRRRNVRGRFHGNKKPWNKN